jgi:hypothetical protein
MILPPLPPELGPLIAIPVFPLRSKLFVAVKVAPPVKVNAWIAAQLIDGDPLGTDIVAVTPAVPSPEMNIALLEDEPDQLKAVSIVTVAAAGNVTLSGGVSANAPNRAAPVIVNGAATLPELTTEIVAPLKFKPPLTRERPAAALAENMTLPVLAVTEKLVAVLLSQRFP